MATNIQAKSLRAMAQIILAVVTSRLLYFLLRPLGQTKFVCNLLGGIILGRSGLGRNQIIKDKMFHEKDAPLLATMALLGTIYSMFLVAVKFDINMVKRTKLAWKIGVPVLIFTVAVTLSLGYPLASTIPGFNGEMFFPIFCFSFVSFTFFPVIAQALDELNLMNSELGQIAMSSALITEFIQWVFTAVQSIVTEKSVTQGGLTFIALVAMSVFAVYAIRPLMLSITKNTPEGQEVKECYVAAILVGVLVMSFVFDAIGCSIMLGAVILGLVIPDGPPLGAAIVGLSPLVVLWRSR